MKKAAILTLLSVSMLALTACDKKLSKAKYDEKLNEAISYVETTDDIKDVHVQTRLSIEVWDYKENEYFKYRYFVLALIIPIEYGHATWKGDDGKYYHSEMKVDLKNEGWKTVEIDETQFNTYMTAHKAEIKAELLKPLNLAKNLSDEKVEEYSSIKSSYKQTMEGNYVINSKCQQTIADESSSKTYDITYAINFKNKLPVSYQKKTKDNSENKTSTDKTSYTYGKSSFTAPGSNNNN